jgi:hypothetical protein
MFYALGSEGQRAYEMDRESGRLEGNWALSGLVYPKLAHITFPFHRFVLIFD